ncbi:nuclear pore complex protein NUP50A-like [Wolffia australiana]
MSTEKQSADAGHSSKKRFAAGQLTKDNLGDNDDNGPEPEMGTFRRASNEVLATRRIVKVRRQQPPSSSTEPSSNPFAQISFSVQPPPASAIQTETSPQEKTEELGTKTANGEGEAEQNGQAEVKVTMPTEENPEIKDKEAEAEPPSEEAAPAVESTGTEAEDEAEPEKEENKTEPQPALSSFQQLSSSQNAFSGLAKGGTGFSGSSFSGSVFGLSGGTTPPAYPSFGIGTATTTSLFSAIPSGGSSGTAAALPEVPMETGEENEVPAFAADAILFEFIDGRWKERGKGELKVNISNSPNSKKSRLVMRARGNLRLILNANLYPDMALTAMEKRGVTFTCINSAGTAAEEKTVGLATFALKFKDPSIVEEFTTAVEANKGKKLATAAAE